GIEKAREILERGDRAQARLSLDQDRSLLRTYALEMEEAHGTPASVAAATRRLPKEVVRVVRKQLGAEFGEEGVMEKREAVLVVPDGKPARAVKASGEVEEGEEGQAVDAEQKKRAEMLRKAREWKLKKQQEAEARAAADAVEGGPA